MTSRRTSTSSSPTTHGGNSREEGFAIEKFPVSQPMSAEDAQCMEIRLVSNRYLINSLKPSELFVHPFWGQVGDEVVIVKSKYFGYLRQIERGEVEQLYSTCDRLVSYHLLRKRIPDSMPDVFMCKIVDIEYRLNLVTVGRKAYPVTIARYRMQHSATLSAMDASAEFIKEQTHEPTFEFDHLELPLSEAFIFLKSHFLAALDYFKNHVREGSTAFVFYHDVGWCKGTVAAVDRDKLIESVTIRWSEIERDHMSPWEIREISRNDGKDFVPQLDEKIITELESLMQKLLDDLKNSKLQKPDAMTTPYPILIVGINERLEEGYYRTLDAFIHDFSHILKFVRLQSKRKEVIDKISKALEKAKHIVYGPADPLPPSIHHETSATIKMVSISQERQEQPLAPSEKPSTPPVSVKIRMRSNSADDAKVEHQPSQHQRSLTEKTTQARRQSPAHVPTNGQSSRKQSPPGLGPTIPKSQTQPKKVQSPAAYKLPSNESPSLASSVPLGALPTIPKKSDTSAFSESGSGGYEKIYSTMKAFAGDGSPLPDIPKIANSNTRSSSGHQSRKRSLSSLSSGRRNDERDNRERRRSKEKERDRGRDRDRSSRRRSRSRDRSSSSEERKHRRRSFSRSNSPPNRRSYSPDRRSISPDRDFQYDRRHREHKRRHGSDRERKRSPKSSRHRQNSIRERGDQREHYSDHNYSDYGRESHVRRERSVERPCKKARSKEERLDQEHRHDRERRHNLKPISPRRADDKSNGIPLDTKMESENVLLDVTPQLPEVIHPPMSTTATSALSSEVSSMQPETEFTIPSSSSSSSSHGLEDMAQRISQDQLHNQERHVARLEGDSHMDIGDMVSTPDRGISDNDVEMDTTEDLILPGHVEQEDVPMDQSPPPAPSSPLPPPSLHFEPFSIHKFKPKQKFERLPVQPLLEFAEDTRENVFENHEDTYNMVRVALFVDSRTGHVSVSLSENDAFNPEHHRQAQEWKKGAEKLISKQRRMEQSSEHQDSSAKRTMDLSLPIYSGIKNISVRVPALSTDCIQRDMHGWHGMKRHQIDDRYELCIASTQAIIRVPSHSPARVNHLPSELSLLSLFMFVDMGADDGAALMQHVSTSISIATRMTEPQLRRLHSLYASCSQARSIAQCDRRMFLDSDMVTAKLVSDTFGFLIEDGFDWYSEGFYLRIATMETRSGGVLLAAQVAALPTTLRLDISTRSHEIQIFSV